MRISHALVAFSSIVVSTASIAQDASIPIDVRVEEDTGSLWVTAGQFIGERVIAEWRHDGTLIRMPEPFSPFKYRHPRVLTFEAPQTAGMILGKFGVVSHFRGLYRRGDDGEFRVEDAFQDPSLLGCVETPTSTPCHVTSLFVDKRGISGVTIFDQDRQNAAMYWDGAAYRAPRGVEMHLDFNDLFFSSLVWSSDGEKAILGTSFSMTPQFSYTVVDASGRAQKTIAVDTGEAPVSYALSRAGETIFATARVFGAASSIDVHRIDDAFSDSPRATRLVRVPLAVSEAPAIVGIDETHLYFSLAGRLRAVELASGASTEVLDCGSPQAGGILLSRQLTRDPGLWLSCGRSVFRLARGSVTWKHEVATPVRSGRVLTEDPENPDVVVVTTGGQLVRLGQNGVKAVVELSSSPGAPGLAPIWEEGGKTCGVSQLGQRARVLCRERGVWNERSLAGDFHPPQMVTRVAGRFWGVSKVAQKVFVYAQEQAANDEWSLKGEFAWPETSTLSAPRLIGFGRHIALDMGEESLHYSDGTSFRQAYRHQRWTTGFEPGFDSDGNLYDVCEGDVPTNQRRVCKIDAAGTATAMPPPVSQFAFQGRFVGLARGGLIVDFNSPVVVRGSRVIDIGQLYGQFLRAPGANFSLTVKGGGEGAVLIQKSTSFSDDREPLLEYFRFDGARLEEVPFSPRRFSKPSGNDGTVANSGVDLGRVWQGDDGVWRAIRGGAQGVTYGESAFDAQFSEVFDRPNDVNAAAVFGSDVVLATDSGLWVCPHSAMTPVDGRTTKLPATRGCRLAQSWPFVRAVAVRDDVIFVLSGKKLLTLAGPDDAHPVVVSTNAERLSGLLASSSLISWLEGNVVRFDDPARGSSLVVLPEGVSARDVLRLSGEWLCAGDKGLFALEGSAGGPREFRKAGGISRCKALVSAVDIVATDGRDTYQCNATTRECEVRGPLPKPFLSGDDTAFGHEASGRAAAVFGSDLYVWTGTAWDERTPRYAAGSLIVTKATSVAGGLLSMMGGGVAFVGDGESRHLRVE